MFVGFLDEFGSGVPALGAPEIRHDFGLGFTALSGLLLTAPLAVALLIETPLFLWSDRWSKRWAVPIALGVTAALGGAAVWVESSWALAVLLTLWAPAGGIAVGLARAALMNAFPEDRERLMARWTLMGSAGDAAAPLGAILVAWVGGSWRTTLAAFAAMTALHAALIAVAPLSEGAAQGDGDDDSELGQSLSRRLLDGLRNVDLLVWLGAKSLCCLLDEIWVTFGGLMLRERLGATLAERSAVVVAFALGAGAGLLLLERLLGRTSPLRLLAGSSAACLATFLAWLAAPTIAASIVLAFALGAFTAPLYPITAAQTHHACPGRPGVVAAVGQLFQVVPLTMPLLLGLFADCFGIRWALGLLTLQPLGVFLVAIAWQSRRRRR